MGFTGVTQTINAEAELIKIKIHICASKMKQFWRKKMVQSGEQRKKQLVACTNLISRSTVSCVLVLLAQFCISLVPRYLSASPLLIQLPLSGLVLLLVVAFGKFCKRVAGVNESAPAFVFFNILFVWGLYLVIIRQGISRLMDIVFNVEVITLLLGVCRILSSNPGFVTYESSDSDTLLESNVLDLKEQGISADGTCLEYPTQSNVMLKRIRYCKSCKSYVKRFDHHCPAFGNCIGQQNYVLFMVLLVGFLATEGFYIVCSLKYAGGSWVSVGSQHETNLARSLVVGTMLFSILQVLWQAVFVAWHVYCVCFNIRTDEWINWKKYPEFQLAAQSQQGECFSDARFKNPYDKGLLQNVKEFLAARD